MLHRNGCHLVEPYVFIPVNIVSYLDCMMEFVSDSYTDCVETCLIKLSPVGHTPSADRPEHAIEVQLPFLQRVIGQFQLVPIIMGDQGRDACRALGVALAKLVAGTNTLIVASSDLSHYPTYDEAEKLDHKTLKAIEEYDYFDLSRNLELRVWEACGGGPIVATMIAAERLGATQAKLLDYANSGDTAGDHSRAVRDCATGRSNR